MSGEPKTLTPPWQYYRRKGLSEMRPYVPGEDLSGISVSEADRATMAEDARWGMVTGGYIARNPKNHADQWYVAKAYADKNLEPVGVRVVARDEANDWPEFRKLLTAKLVEAFDNQNQNPPLDPETVRQAIEASKDFQAELKRLGLTVEDDEAAELRAENERLRADLFEYVLDGFVQGAHRQEDGGYNTGGISTYRDLGNWLVEHAHWTRRDGGSGRMQTYDPPASEAGQ